MLGLARLAITRRPRVAGDVPLYRGWIWWFLVAPCGLTAVVWGMQYCMPYTLWHQTTAALYLRQTGIPLVVWGIGWVTGGLLTLAPLRMARVIGLAATTIEWIMFTVCVALTTFVTGERAWIHHLSDLNEAVPPSTFAAGMVFIAFWTVSLRRIIFGDNDDPGGA